MSKTLIYADHAATTALAPAALDSMKPWLFDKYGNPSTLYSLARDPRKAISTARKCIAEAIGANPEEVFFTSGGTEADNWAIKGMAFQHASGKRIVTSTIEHHAVLNSCESLKRMGYQIVDLPVDKKGIISPETLSNRITKGTILVSIMMANNEIGTIEPIRELVKVARQNDCVFHTDAVQAVGHIPIDVKEMGVDMLSASAHKFNGPKGIGFLYIRSGIDLVPLIDGGGQERGMRAGTENVAGIVGMATALQGHIKSMASEKMYLNKLSKQLIEVLRHNHLDFLINGSDYRIPGNLSLSFRDFDGEMLLHRLDLMGTAVATGSACNSKDTVLSHVIKAIGVPKEYANGTIRVTFGMDNTEDDAIIIGKQISRIISED